MKSRHATLRMIWAMNDTPHSKITHTLVKQWNQCISKNPRWCAFNGSDLPLYASRMIQKQWSCCLLDIADTLVTMIRLYIYYELVIVIYFCLITKLLTAFWVICLHQCLLPCRIICPLPTSGIICPLPIVWIREFWNTSTPSQQPSLLTLQFLLVVLSVWAQCYHLSQPSFLGGFWQPCVVLLRIQFTLFCDV